MRKALLWCLIVSPVFYYLGLIVGSFFYPDYSHVTQYASELGAAGAPHPAIFNLGAIGYGLTTVVGAVGLRSALAEVSGRRRLATLAAVALLLWGVAIVLAGLFPMPDERHGAYGLGMAGQFTSLFALLALWRVPDSKGIRVFLAVIFVTSMALFVIMMGVGGLVRVAHVGIWQRVNGLFAIPWISVLGIWLLQRVRARGRPEGEGASPPNVPVVVRA